MTGWNWRVIRWVAVIAAVTVVLAFVVFRGNPSSGSAAADTSWLPPVGTAPAAAPSAYPSAKPKPTPRPSRSARTTPTPTGAPKITPAPGGHLAVAVLDRTTGQRMTVNGTERFHTASIVKVDILATLLWQQQQAGTTMTSSQKSMAYKMITVSDNDAADALWALIGKQSGLNQGNKIFGLTHTTPGTTTVHPWGQTLTTVGDQLTLLGVLTDSNSPLTAANRTYILGLMAAVVSSQRWGIPTAASHATVVCVKNGWLAEQSDNWLWIINSIGRIIEPGHDFLVVTLSDHSRTEDAAIAAVENAAKVAVSSLRNKA